MTALLPLQPALASGGDALSIGVCGTNSAIRIPLKKERKRSPDCPGACHAACSRSDDPGDEASDGTDGDPGNP